MLPQPSRTCSELSPPIASYCAFACSPVGPSQCSGLVSVPWCPHGSPVHAHTHEAPLLCAVRATFSLGLLCRNTWMPSTNTACLCLSSHSLAGAETEHRQAIRRRTTQLREERKLYCSEILTEYFHVPFRATIGFNKKHAFIMK